MISIIINWAYILLTTFVIGGAFSYVVEKIFKYKIKCINNIIALGLVIATVYSQFFSLFYKVGFVANVAMIGVCVFLIILLKNKVYIPYIKYQKEIYDNSSLVEKILLLITILIWAYCTSRGYMHYDSDLYHAQSIRWIEEYGVVKGLGNIHVRFAYNSSFFALSALYSMSFIGEALHTVNGFIALLLSVEVLKLTKVFVDKRFLMADYARIGAFYYLTLIYSDIVSPASDYAIMCTVFYIVIKWLGQLEEDSENIIPFALLCVGGVFAVSLKLTAGLLLILTIKPAYMLIKEKRIKDIFIFIFMGIVVIMPWILRTIVISGYLLYPFPKLDLFDVDWKINAAAAALDAAEIKTWGRGLNNAALVDLPLNQWLSIWFRNTLPTLGKILILADVICIGIFIIIILKKMICGFYRRKVLRKSHFFSNQYKKDCYNLSEFSSGKDKMLEKEYMFALFVGIVSYIFWQLSAPLLRYGYAYVLLVIFLTVGIVVNIFKLWFIKLGIGRHGRLYDVVFYAGVAIVIIFIILKSGSLIKYVYNNVSKPYYVHQQEYGKYDLDSYDVNNVTFYYPLTGDRVGYDAFPAIPYKKDIEFRGNDISDGFFGKK